MAVEVNIVSPGSGVTAGPSPMTTDLVVQGFCRAPGGQPAVEVWVTNGNTGEVFPATVVTIIAVPGAPGFYQWTATFVAPTNFNIPTTMNRHHRVKAILTTQQPLPGLGDFVTRLAEVHIKGAGFPLSRPPGKPPKGPPKGKPRRRP